MNVITNNTPNNESIVVDREIREAAFCLILMKKKVESQMNVVVSQVEAETKPIKTLNKYRKWDDDEKRRLVSLVKIYQKDWEQISIELGTKRTSHACQSLYSKIFQKNKNYE